MQMFPVISIVVYDTVENMYFNFVLDKKLDKIVTDESETVNDNGEKIKQMFIYCNTEQVMLRSFIRLIRKVRPSLMTGWYSEDFDIPYLIHRIEKMFDFDETGLTLGWIDGIKQSTFKTHTRQGDTKFYNSCPGIETLDYMQVYKKLSYKNPPSWGLDNVQEFEGFGGKTEKKGFLNYETDFKKFIDYIYTDVDLLVKIDNKMKLLDIMFGLQSLVKIPLKYVMNASFVVEQMIYHQTIKDNIVIQSVHYNDYEGSYQGQIVLDPEDKTYNNVVVLDYQSLYPNTIVTFNISPETLLVGEDKLKWQDDNNIPYLEVTEHIKCTEERVAYRIDKEGFLSKQVKMLLETRLYYKKLKNETQKDDPMRKIYDLKQLNYKIIINALYGYLGFKRSPLFNIIVQESITQGQRFMLMSSIDIVDKKEFYYNPVLKETNYVEKQKEDLIKHKDTIKHKIDVIYGDTDSIFTDSSYFETDKLNCSYDEIELYGNTMQEFINEELNKYIYSLTKNSDIGYVRSLNTEQIDLDKQFKRVRFFGTKKRYYGYDFDGKDLMHGVELVRSDTPKFPKKVLGKFFRDQLDNDLSESELINEFKNLKQQNLKDIGEPKSITKLNYKQYKVLPFHVRGLLFQKELGIDIPDVITDKVLILPQIITKLGDDKKYYDLWLKQREIFNIKRKTSVTEKISLQVTDDLIDSLLEYVTENHDFIRIDYLEIYNKQVLNKIKQFSNYIKLIDNVYLTLNKKHTEMSLNETFKLFG